MLDFAFRVRVVSLFAGAAALAATVSQAQAPAKPPVSAETYAAAQATIDFCSGLDAAHAGDLRAHEGLFLNGATEDELAGLRSTPAYRASYESTSTSLKRMSKDEAARTCNGLLQTTP